MSIVRGISARLRNDLGAVVHTTGSTVTFEDALLGMRWLVGVQVTASGEITVTSFGQLTTVVYKIRYAADGYKPALALGLVAGALAFLIRTPAPVGVVALVAGLFGLGWVYRILPSAAGWFEIRLRSMASTSSYGSDRAAPA